MLPDLNNYYKITFNSDGSGGNFNFEVAVARVGAFTGSGGEFGNGSVPGADQLMAVAEGIASGIQSQSTPYWDNITVVSVEVNPTDSVQIYPAP